MGISYKMSKAMYDGIKRQKVWNPKMKKMINSGKGLSEKEILQYVNNTFGLLKTVTRIVID